MPTEEEYEQFFILLDTIVHDGRTLSAKKCALEDCMSERDEMNLDELASWFE